MKPLKRSDIQTVKAHREEPTVPSGMMIWAIIMYLKQTKWDRQEVIDLLEGHITEADVDFAERYYREHRDEIDFKLNSL